MIRLLQIDRVKCEDTLEFDDILQVAGDILRKGYIDRAIHTLPKSVEELLLCQALKLLGVKLIPILEESNHSIDIRIPIEVLGFLMI